MVTTASSNVLSSYLLFKFTIPTMGLINAHYIHNTVKTYQNLKAKKCHGKREKFETGLKLQIDRQGILSKSKKQSI